MTAEERQRTIFFLDQCIIRKERELQDMRQRYRETERELEGLQAVRELTTGQREPA